MQKDKYDAIIVLSGGQTTAGDLPAGIKRSVKVACKLAKQQNAKIVFTGGFSYKDKEGPSQSEAAAMAEYAHALGAPSEYCVIEEESKDTFGNAYFTKINVLIPNAWVKLLVVPGPNHSTERVQYIFTKVLGPEYSFDIVVAEQNTEPANISRENKSLDLFKIWVEDVNDGDHEAYMKIMLQKHPAYSQNPEYSVGQIQNILGEN